MDPTAKQRIEAAHPFVTDEGQTISGKDHEITMAFLRGGHSLESVNRMRRGAGLSPIRITGTLKKEEREALTNDIKGLNDGESIDSDENQIQIGINAYNVAKPQIEGKELNPNNGGIGSETNVPPSAKKRVSTSSAGMGNKPNLGTQTPNNLSSTLGR